MPVQNLFDQLPAQLPEEMCEVVAQSSTCRIERILSRGHASPEGFWYDQPRAEWVVLLKGAARLGFEDSGEQLEMRPGDYVFLPAYCRHRVEWTTPAETTVWLAVHYAEDGR